MGEIRIVGPGKTRGYPYLVCKRRICSLKESKVFLFQSYVKKWRLSLLYLSIAVHVLNYTLFYELLCLFPGGPLIWNHEHMFETGVARVNECYS